MYEVPILDSTKDIVSTKRRKTSKTIRASLFDEGIIVGTSTHKERRRRTAGGIAIFDDFLHIYL